MNKRKSDMVKYEQFLVPVPGDSMTKAEEAWARGLLTKCEVKCCRILAKSSGNKKKLQACTAEYTDKTSKDWKDGMQPDLAVLVNESLYGS